MRCPANNLRRRVAKSSAHFVWKLSIHDGREPEVREFDADAVGLGGEQDVLRLDVVVYHAAGVDVL